MTISKIAVDLRARTFEIEVPDAKIGEVLDRLEALFNLPVPTEVDEISLGEEAPAAKTVNAKATAVSENANVPNTQAKRRSRANAKPKAYELVDLNLSDAQRNEIREYYTEKSPIQQNDCVAVLAVKLKEMLGTSSLGVNEIHSAFKVVNQPTPKNLIAVFGNMKRDGRASYSDNKLHVNSHTEDYVNYHMKKTASKKPK